MNAALDAHFSPPLQVDPAVLAFVAGLRPQHRCCPKIFASMLNHGSASFRYVGKLVQQEYGAATSGASERECATHSSTLTDAHKFRIALRRILPADEFQALEERISNLYTLKYGPPCRRHGGLGGGGALEDDEQELHELAQERVGAAAAAARADPPPPPSAPPPPQPPPAAGPGVGRRSSLPSPAPAALERPPPRRGSGTKTIVL
eukprot:tig00021012_g16983.t1